MKKKAKVIFQMEIIWSYSTELYKAKGIVIKNENEALAIKWRGQETVPLRDGCVRQQREMGYSLQEISSQADNSAKAKQNQQLFPRISSSVVGFES